MSQGPPCLKSPKGRIRAQKLRQGWIHLRRGAQMSTGSFSCRWKVRGLFFSDVASLDGRSALTCLRPGFPGPMQRRFGIGVLFGKIDGPGSEPPGKPGIALYFSTKSTKKDTYVLLINPAGFQHFAPGSRFGPFPWAWHVGVFSGAWGPKEFTFRSHGPRPGKPKRSTCVWCVSSLLDHAF